MATYSETRIEDCVEYYLFPCIDGDKCSNEKLNEKLNETLEAVMVELSPLLVEYMWQNEHFNLQSGNEDLLPACLQGSTQFGNNIEDEWFIVYLLLKLTKVFDGMIAKISDNDGEFLLIEGANSLPKWLNPNTSTDRVYLYQGEIHIIPLPVTPAEMTWLPPGSLTVQQAVHIIRGHPDRTLASKPIRDAIYRRLQGYPGKIHQQIHRARCYLPAKAATVLQHYPSLVAQAAQAFCHRDPIDMKACRFMKFFPPEDLVLSQVKFTRCLYAELVHHRFQPPLRSGWKIPSSSSPKHKSHDLGIKLAYGLEILCSRCRSPPAKLDPETKEDAIWNSSLWQRYLESLKQKGYFRGEIEGSTLYTTLLSSAKKFYLETVNEGTRNISDPGYKVLEILQTVTCNVEELSKKEKHLPVDDDESWLTLTAEELDKLIESAAGRPLRNPTATMQENETDPEEVDFSPDLLTDTMKSFVDKVSSFEGAEFPKDSESAPISFDAESFEQIVKNLLEYRTPVEKDEDSDDFLSSDDESDDDTTDAVSCTETDLPSGIECNGTEVEEIRELMSAMDQELGATTIGESFEKEPQNVSHEELGADGEEKDELRPVEVDLNLLKNLLESYSSQNGLAGPASNILHSMGIKLPDNADDT
ncbi:protein ecdysoneless homolog [Anneissia japonica]|uniref:protein ecdysoneless homolog n=1 Tax=Anneissia japonica TaxID=1529436 RepID=UPI0014259889|nr:protein ecdysoneless homolog [Anneissia japonica]